MDVLKWLAVIIICFMIAIVANPHYANMNLSIRILTIILLIGMGSSMAILTNKGQCILEFFQKAKNEARKVMWPSSQETLYTTFIVIGITSVISIILWVLDGILFHLVRFLTSLRF
ncbi:MAG: preprotein translocase subunit SecE [Candidatus Dasytiphilus stammeri]